MNHKMNRFREHNDNVINFDPLSAKGRKVPFIYLDPNGSLSPQNHTNDESSDQKLMVKVLDALDSRSEFWSYSVGEFNVIGNLLFVTASLEIDGIRRHAVGAVAANGADSAEFAERKAFIAAAMRFKFVRDVFETEPAANSGPENSVKFPENPLALNLFDLISAKQLEIIKTTAKDLRLDPGKECLKFTMCEVGELSKAAAQSLIAHLYALRDRIECEPEFPLRIAG